MAMDGIGGYKNINNFPPINKNQSSTPALKNDEPTFGEVLNNKIENVNHKMLSADEEVKLILGGKSSNLHETMISLEKADISFRFMMKIRNKLVESYREVMRMQV